MNIIVECYGDTLLVKQLHFSPLAVHSGIGQVANLMKKYHKNRLAIGIIDNDKTSIPRYFQEFRQVSRTNALIFLKHPAQNHYLIKIAPAFERFITNAANEVGVNKTDYRLPPNDKNFRDITKDEKLSKNQNFVNFLNAVIANNPSAIQDLRNCINEAINIR